MIRNANGLAKNDSNHRKPYPGAAEDAAHEVEVLKRDDHPVHGEVGEDEHDQKGRRGEVQQVSLADARTEEGAHSAVGSSVRKGG